MKAITIRGVDARVSEKLKKAAINENKSINQYVIDILKENLGITKKKQFTKTHNDLDHLFGKWSQKEYENIQNSIDAGRKIDRELWE
ncbi:MAG: antitoxin [Proteobacteria bacterium]|nr:antitoxin [Pseudomonadota bacterium]MBU1386349.1 antitoxin [Pseudomonadota bacterium]MBU1541365.1 antitoxin [Pseudomonadota bacterium]MBU2482510.1 antitoxin [Pseudomonadota bacterium]